MKQQRLWPWFVGGMGAVFLLLAVFLQVFGVAPSGQALVRMPLWRFYAAEISQMFVPQSLGLSSSNSNQFLVLVLQHAALSAVGGLIMLLVGWGLRRLKDRRLGEPPTD